MEQEEIENEVQEQETEQIKVQGNYSKPLLSWQLTPVNNVLRVGEIHLSSNCESMQDLHTRAVALLLDPEIRKHLKMNESKKLLGSVDYIG